MRKLEKYAKKSQLMNISVKLGEELFKFNLFEELVVDENIINEEVRSQPTIAGFLSSLAVKLDRIKEDKLAESDKIYHRLFVKFKKAKNDMGRPNTDDMAKSLTLSHKNYIESTNKYRQAKENSDLIRACVKVFEQRSFLIQTLSANIRKSN